ncbi:hypothetical protein [Streptomyces sp. NPDC060031]|uniref:hypothetical protein n=1 Tax=Streptomyces sp. NPDC060031 TaxID=3347043 RepID=UPI0036C47855
MPDGGYYAKTPRPESLQTVKRVLSQHSAIRGYEEVETQFFKVDRFKHPAVNLYVTNIYTVGVADVQEIIEGEASITCILTVSAWNSYTPQAREYAKAIGVGLFRFYEMMGALNYAGNEFLDYIAPQDRR